MKTLYSIILLFISLSSYAQYHYIIEGKFDTELLGDNNNYSIRDGDLIYLEFSSLSRTDTTRVKDKMFRFEGQSSKPEVASLSVSLQHYGKEPAFGNAMLLDNCHYSITYTQVADEHKRVYYDDKIKTNSVFYNSWVSINAQKWNYLSKEKELLEILESGTNAQNKVFYEQELTEIRKALDDLYRKIAQENQGTYEVTYLLLGDPKFSYGKYIDLYNDLPDSVKDSFYGKNFYENLLRTKPKTD